MRILFLLTQDLESPAGIGRYFPWAKALVQRGHQVSIAALHADYAHVNQRHFVRDGVDIRYLAQMHVLKRGNQKVYFSTPKLIYYTLRATCSLIRTGLVIPADIIHLGKPQPMNSLAGWIAKKLRGRVLFVDCDDLETANNRFGGGWQRWVVSFFERKIPLQADQVTTHTHVLVEQLLTLGIPNSRITYLPHGFDRLRFANPSSAEVDDLREKLGIKGKQVIIYVGSMSLGSHAVDLLLDAFAIFKQSHPESILVLVGGGEDYDVLRNKTHEMGLDSTVIFCGRVPANEAPIYYQLGNVSIDPIPDNPSGRASLSLKMIETWASGIPLITVDVGDRRNILGDPPAGVIVEPGAPVALAHAIGNIFDQPELAKILVERGRKRSNEFTWDRLAEKMESVYASVLLSRKLGK
jgi:glycosyltransferase involved in cell wall biosynthesis